MANAVQRRHALGGAYGAGVLGPWTLPRVLPGCHQEVRLGRAGGPPSGPTHTGQQGSVTQRWLQGTKGLTEHTLVCPAPTDSCT